MASYNNPILVKFTTRWIKKKKVDPVLFIKDDLKRWAWLIAQWIVAITAGCLGWALAPILSPYVPNEYWMIESEFRLLPVSISIVFLLVAVSFSLVSYLQKLFLEPASESRDDDYESTREFIRGLDVLTIKSVRAGGWSKFAHDPSLQNIARRVLFQQAGEILYLQSIPWRAKEATDLKNLFLRNLDSLSILADVSDDIGDYLSTEEIRKFNDVDSAAQIAEARIC